MSSPKTKNKTKEKEYGIKDMGSNQKKRGHFRLVVNGGSRVSPSANIQSSLQGGPDRE